jgi:hypothetical protein
MPAAEDGSGANTDLTLVFDLGPRVAPVRVSLPLDAHIRESREDRTSRGAPINPVESVIPPIDRFRWSDKLVPVGVAGAALLALVTFAIWFMTVVWAGAVAPRAVTATSGDAQSPPPVTTPALAPGGAARLLRERPSTAAPVVASIPGGTRVEVLDGAEFAEGLHWLRVRTADGKVGWVASAVQRGSSAGSGDQPLPPTPDT